MFSESRNDRNRRIGDRLRDRNVAGVGNNSAEIGDDAAGSSPSQNDTMLNSVLNGDWSNSVPGRQFLKGHLRSYTELPRLTKLCHTLCIVGNNVSIILTLHQLSFI